MITPVILKKYRRTLNFVADDEGLHLTVVTALVELITKISTNNFEGQSVSYVSDQFKNGYHVMGPACDQVDHKIEEIEFDHDGRLFILPVGVFALYVTHRLLLSMLLNRQRLRFVRVVYELRTLAKRYFSNQVYELLFIKQASNKMVDIWALPEVQNELKK